MNKFLIHPNLMSSLFRFFNSTCDIQEPTYPTDGETEPSGWTSVESDVNCVISRIKGGSDGNEIRRSDKTVVLHPYGIVLDGVYSVTESNSILSSGNRYDILSVDYDSKGNMTSLICERIKW